MSWEVVPCLRQLRTEFNLVAPDRDRGADGTIGDQAHRARSSDHNPDDTAGSRTPGSDLDHDAEVHALDIDATGPWPAGTDLDLFVEHIRQGEAKAGEKGRLQNIIWRGRVASRSWGWAWRSDDRVGHYDHAHFSARYATVAETNVRPYGLAALVAGRRPRTPEVAVQDDLITLTDAFAKRLGKPKGTKLKLSILLQYVGIAVIDGLAAVEELTEELTPPDGVER